MQACRYALEVVAKHPIYLLVYVGFLSLMGLFITSGVYPPATSAGYESAEVPFAVIDRIKATYAPRWRRFSKSGERRSRWPMRRGPARMPWPRLGGLSAPRARRVRGGLSGGGRDGGDGPRLETVFSFQSMQARWLIPR